MLTGLPFTADQNGAERNKTRICFIFIFFFLLNITKTTSTILKYLHYDVFCYSRQKLLILLNLAKDRLILANSVPSHQAILPRDFDG